jgi:hypothetical protein
MRFDCSECFRLSPRRLRALVPVPLERVHVLTRYVDHPCWPRTVGSVDGSVLVFLAHFCECWVRYWGAAMIGGGPAKPVAVSAMKRVFAFTVLVSDTDLGAQSGRATWHQAIVMCIR